MKRLAQFLIRLYPPAWRERYGHEIGALLSDATITSQDTFDIFLAALKMRLIQINYRFLAAMALLGLVLAAAISIQLPKRYVASATLRVSPLDPIDTSATFTEAGRLKGNATSRTALGNLILAADLKLYDHERQTQRLEQVIANMKADDLRLTADPDGTLTVSYRGKSPVEAADTVRHLVAGIQADHAGHQTHVAAAQRTSSRLDVREPSGLPPRSTSPSPLAVTLTGLLGGLTLAGLFTVIRRAPKVWLTASLGLALFTPIASLLPVPFEASATVLFNSVNTRILLTTDPARLSADLEKQARILGGGPSSFYGLDLHPATPLLLTIRTRHADPNIALELVQIAITRLIAEGPGLEVVDPPVVPTSPMGREVCEVILAASLALGLLSGGFLIFKKQHPQLTLQPV